MFEMINTEEGYIVDLLTLIDVFIIPLRDASWVRSAVA